MIRPATLSDVPRLVDLGELMHAESPRFSRLRFSPDKLTGTLSHLIESENGLLLVAESDQGEIIGGLAAIAVEHWCSSDMMATDLALFIAPRHRGSRAAAKLVQAYLSWAGRRGIGVVQLGISTGFHVEQTAKLYSLLGLHQCGLIFEV